MSRLITFIILTLITSTLSAQEKLNVLFLGNSYTSVNNLPQLCVKLAESAGKTINAESVTPGGYTLAQHASNILTLNKIRQGEWDFVVFQEQSQLPAIDFYRREMMLPAYCNLRDTVAFYNPGAQVVGYLTWGRRFGGQQCEDYGLGLYCSADFADFGQMQDSLTNAYNECRELYGGLTAAVGEAWRNAIDQTGMTLHSNDNSHPSIEGSFLAACVFHCTFWNESSTGLFHPDNISEKNAALLQTIADETALQISSTSENHDANDFKISTSESTIVISSEKTSNAMVSVYDILGNELAKAEINNVNNCVINSYNFKKDVYIIRIIDKNTLSATTFKINMR